MYPLDICHITNQGDLLFPTQRNNFDSRTRGRRQVFLQTAAFISDAYNMSLRANSVYSQKKKKIKKTPEKYTIADVQQMTHYNKVNPDNL